MTVGGMPQAVERFVDTRDFAAVDRVKRRILNLYRDDIHKHGSRNQLKIEAIFDEIPSQLKNQNRHFKLSALEEHARFSAYAEPLFWLADAMIVNNCYNTTDPSIGLKMNQDRTILKCYMGDTGLLISHAFDENGSVSQEIYRKLLLDKLEVDMGMVMENIVAQMLVSGGHKLYFYTNSDRENKDNRMEIDFLIAKKTTTNRHNISPIEVKSSKRYTLRSIQKFTAKYSEQLHTAYVLHPGDLKVENDLVYLPLYMTPLL
jgi:predicted AAA+ superfamily ATPase